MDRNRIKELLYSFTELISLSKDYRKTVESGNYSYENKKVVQDYLEQFEYTDVALFMAVMYIGRDDYISKDRFEDKRDYYREIDEFYDDFDPEEAIRNACDYIIKHGDSKVIMIDQMLSKTPLASYLEQGLDVIRVKRLIR